MSKERQVAMTTLQAAAVPAGVVRTTEEIFACDHLDARQWFRTIDHADMGTHRYNGSPFRVIGFDRPPDLPPPMLGEHGHDLLRERLGYAKVEIEVLFETGVTGRVVARDAETPEQVRSSRAAMLSENQEKP